MRLFSALCGRGGFWQSTACCSMACSAAPGHKAGAERPVQVKTAAAACAVQRFAHKVKARTALELEVLIHLPQGQPAAGGLGLLPAAGGQPFKAPVLGGVGQLLPLCGGEHGSSH